MGVDLDPPTLCYKKPFHLYHYNRPKLPPLPSPKPINYNKEPSIPIKYNNATKMRNKVIKEYSTREMNPYIDYGSLNIETVKAITEDPNYLPRDTKTTQYRYKFVRDIPVVSCRFTEHVMMYRKPPFSFEKPPQPGDLCGRYKMRKMMLHEPEKHYGDDELVGAESYEFLPSILQ